MGDVLTAWGLGCQGLQAGTLGRMNPTITCIRTKVRNAAGIVVCFHDVWIHGQPGPVEVDATGVKVGRLLTSTAIATYDGYTLRYEVF